MALKESPHLHCNRRFLLYFIISMLGTMIILFTAFNLKRLNDIALYAERSEFSRSGTLGICSIPSWTVFRATFSF